MMNISSHLPDMVDAYIAYREQRLIKDREAAELKELEEGLKKAIIAKFKEQGYWALGGRNGTIKMTAVEEPQGEDWQQIWNYIQETGQFDLLHRRLANQAVKERWDAGVEIPGVGKQTVYKLSVSGAK